MAATPSCPAACLSSHWSGLSGLCARKALFLRHFRLPELKHLHTSHQKIKTKQNWEFLRENLP